MFKFIHAADIHLDSPLRGLSRYESAPLDAIRGASRKAFENLVELAIEEKVAFVLLAGDLYDGDWKDYSTGIFLSQQMGRLGRHGIRVFAVAGNHDAANRMTKVLDTPGNMTILSSRKTDTVILNDLKVAIHGRSYHTRHVGDEFAAGFPPAEKACFNIGLLHTSLDGRREHAVYAPCTTDELASKGYQYWALGHVHKHEIVSQDPWIVFPGCIQGRHIREAGPKGCVLVTVAGQAVEMVETIPLDVLRWMFCTVDLSDVEDLRALLTNTRQAIQKLQQSADGRPMALRIRFEGATAMANEIAAHPERIEHQVRALGAEMADGELWIERVENGSFGKHDLQTAMTANNAFATLLKEILATSHKPEDIPGLEEIVSDLRQKIPPDVFAADRAIGLDDPRNIARLIDEARHLLLGRLLARGETT